MILMVLIQRLQSLWESSPNAEKYKKVANKANNSSCLEVHACHFSERAPCGKAVVVFN